MIDILSITALSVCTSFSHQFTPNTLACGFNFVDAAPSLLTCSYSTSLKANDMWSKTIGQEANPQVRSLLVMEIVPSLLSLSLFIEQSTHVSTSTYHIANDALRAHIVRSPLMSLEHLVVYDCVYTCTRAQAGSNAAVEASIYAPSHGGSKRAERQENAQKLIEKGTCTE